MSRPGLGETVGAHAELSAGVRPAQPGWTAAMVAALPAAAAERLAFYQPAMIVPVAPPPDADAATLAACGRLAATSLVCNATFAFVARVDGLQWLLGIRDADAFSRAALERLGELGPARGEPRPDRVGTAWRDLATAAIELADRCLRYQQVLPRAAKAISDAAAAASLRSAAQAAMPLMGDVLDVPRRMASELDGRAAAALGARLDAALAEVEVAAAAAPDAAPAIAAVRTALAGWTAPVAALGAALAEGRAAASARGAELDRAASVGDERWQVTSIVIDQVREALAVITASSAGLWTTPSGIDPIVAAALDAAVAPFVAAAARLAALYGAIDAAADAVWP